jgi:NADH-quinone oxidoreductase subunit E
MDPSAYEKRPAEPSLLIDSLFAEIRRKFERRPDELIPMLQRVQRALGFLPGQALIEIAHLTGLPAAKVFGTATFYAQFRFQPVGKHTIRVCRGTACHVKGSDRILEDIQNHLGVIPGRRTEDGLFTLETVACFGSCALAPILVVDDTVYGSMNRSRALKLIDDVRERALAAGPEADLPVASADSLGNRGV